MRVCTSRAASANCASSSPVSWPCAAKYVAQPCGEVVVAQHPDVVGVERVGLLLVEAGGVGVDVDDVERGDHLVEAEHVAVVGDAPAEQRQVVQQPLGDEAALAVQEQVRLRIALGQLLVAVAENAWQMGELGNALRDADADQRLVQRDLARRRRQQVLAAQHVGDLHQRVVDRIDQGVQRISARPGQREVRHGARREGGVAAHQVVPGDVRVGHPQPHHRLAALGDERRALLVGQVAVEVVVAQLGISAGGDVTGLDLLRRRERLVGLARVQQPRHDVAVDLAALRTAGTARTAHRSRGPRRSSRPSQLSASSSAR